jgi:hypothetical protein
MGHSPATRGGYRRCRSQPAKGDTEPAVRFLGDSGRPPAIAPPNRLLLFGGVVEQLLAALPFRIILIQCSNHHISLTSPGCSFSSSSSTFVTLVFFGALDRDSTRYSELQAITKLNQLHILSHPLHPPKCLVLCKSILSSAMNDVFLQSLSAAGSRSGLAALFL